MFTIKIANHTVGFKNRFHLIEKVSCDYKTELSPEIILEANEHECQREDVKGEFFSSYLELLVLHRKTAEWFLQFDIHLMHGVVIEYKGIGIIISASSGIGKSTHAQMWREVFGDSVRIINGDKPFVWIEKDQLMACGTPWCGKEMVQINCILPVKAIIFLQRAYIDSMIKINPKEGFNYLIKYIYYDKVNMISNLSFMERMLSTPCFLLSCTASKNAAIVAYECLKKEELL